MIFKYALRYVAFTMDESLLTGLLSLLFIVLVGRNFVSGTCKLKPKNLENLKSLILGFKTIFSALIPTCYRDKQNRQRVKRKRLVN